MSALYNFPPKHIKSMHVKWQRRSVLQLFIIASRTVHIILIKIEKKKDETGVSKYLFRINIDLTQMPKDNFLLWLSFVLFFMSNIT